MNSRIICVLSLSLTVALGAQEAPAGAAYDPKTKAHERLADLVGVWRTETEMAAMPGVPGMEKPTQMTGVERAELICNGLWLHVAGEGTCAGQSCSSLWLLGYDPHAQTYQCIVASSMDDTPCSIEARYDEKTRVWHFRGDSPMGAFRSEYVMEGADRSVETCWSMGEDGKETQFMRSVRTRLTGADAKNTSRAPAVEQPLHGDAVPAPLAALHADVGTWHCDFRMAMQGQEPMTAKCRETVEPICGGKWTWSTFTGDLMGAPFEGHALTGYDSKTGQVVSFWVDSMNGAAMRTDGTFDAASKTFTMKGTSYDEQGEKQKVASTAKSLGKDQRELRMTFGEGERQHVMTIGYRRARD